jgi:nitrate/nitrite transporter NarK
MIKRRFGALIGLAGAIGALGGVMVNLRSGNPC